MMYDERMSIINKVDINTIIDNECRRIIHKINKSKEELEKERSNLIDEINNFKSKFTLDWMNLFDLFNNKIFNNIKLY